MITQMPEDITAHEDLDALEAELLTEFDGLLDAEENDIAEMTALADAVEVVRSEKARRTEVAAQEVEAVNELLSRVRPVEAVEEEVAAPEGAEETQDNAEDAEEAVEAEVAEDANTESEELVPVTAGANKPLGKPSARAIRANSVSPEVDTPSNPEVVITAAADVPGFAAGQRVSLEQVASAMHARARSLPARSGRASVATFNLPYDESNTIAEGNSVSMVASVLDNVASPQSLVASGGWCAPSETMYDFMAVESTDGLIDLPTVRISRGGVQIPDFLGFGDADDALWTWTEANDIAAADPLSGLTKGYLKIPCPSFTEYRLEAEGLTLTHGNLTDIAYPELGARWLGLALNGHAHRMSAGKVGKIVADAAAFAPTGLGSDVGGDVLNAIDIVVANLRSKYRLANSAVVEAVFPHWATGVLRANFAARAGVAMTNVSDAEIAAHFAARNIRAQFVHAYQPLSTAGALAVQWPATMDFLAYPAGSYVEGTGGSIDLGVVRDSTLNATNDFTLAWTEQFYLVMRRGAQAVETTVSTATFGVTGCCPVA